MARESDSSLLEWPDLAFHHYCLKVYRLNRGVYNTIDQWLFDHGYQTIRGRRSMILRFLEHYANRLVREDDKTLSFGKGKLIVELSLFTAQANTAQADLPTAN
ncbi:hypothetical protein FHS18_003480 [Paenibacillus phyllosphaerae]|uniref:Uncharacterized protein n=1 Tax=Paenibacillus phyllosphaerae TaxID=274593 RepID=A0A7W5AZ21_9BACL|nr:hypothetical protein [Paenibacillus phyllosphaerae]MBB3111412.1 hypothetical protein [Paenibacillus phyllosphaerae]